MKKIYSFIRHNCGVFVGVPCCCLVLIYVYSCQSQVFSLVNSDVKINRQELVIEVNTFLSLAEERFADLDRQDLVRNTIFNSVLDVAQGKPVNPVGVIITLAGILGVGAGVDNIRKRTHINTLKGSLNHAKEPKILS